MSEDSQEDGQSQDNNIDGTIKAVTGLVKEVPVYSDAVQPLAKETGKALHTLGRTVNAALMPLRGLIWGIEQIESFLYESVTQKLKNTPEEDIQTPDPSVAGPALESLRFTGHKESLRDLYSNLLATSMDKNTAQTAHPGFVEIIKNMGSDEAKILTLLANSNHSFPMINIRRKVPSLEGGIDISKYVSFIGAQSKCDHIELMGTYFDNLIRLRLIVIPTGKHLVAPDAYKPLENDIHVKNLMDKINSQEDSEAELEKTYVALTELGKQFAKVCIIEKT